MSGTFCKSGSKNNTNKQGEQTMKQFMVLLMAGILCFAGVAQAKGPQANAALEMAMLLQLADELGMGDYELMDVMAGYRQYRSTMDGYVKQRQEKKAALEAAIANDAGGSTVSTLTQELMSLDMNILRLKQSAVNEAATVMDSAAVAKLYLMVSDMDQAKKNFVNQLTGKDKGPKVAKGPKGKAADPAAAAAKPEESVLDKAKVFLNKLAEKDLTTAMTAVSENFEHYEYGSKVELKSFLEEAIQAGYIDDLKIITDDTEVKIEGDKAVLYPIDVEGLFGSFTLELTGQKEDGKWMVTSMDIFGI